MAFFGLLNDGPTGGWFGNITANLRAITANFALIEPAYADSGAADVVLSLAHRYLTRSRGTAQTVTVPLTATVAIPIGRVVKVEQTGAGALTIQAEGGVTIRKRADRTLVAVANGVVVLEKVATNTWVASGDLTAV